MRGQIEGTDRDLCYINPNCELLNFWEIIELYMYNSISKNKNRYGNEPLFFFMTLFSLIRLRIVPGGFKLQVSHHLLAYNPSVMTC